MMLLLKAEDGLEGGRWPHKVDVIMTMTIVRAISLISPKPKRTVEGLSNPLLSSLMFGV